MELALKRSSEQNAKWPTETATARAILAKIPFSLPSRFPLPAHVPRLPGAKVICLLLLLILSSPSDLAAHCLLRTLSAAADEGNLLLEGEPLNTRVLGGAGGGDVGTPARDQVDIVRFLAELV